MQYIIRRNKLDYEIAKFDDTSVPVSIYHINFRGCSCPSRSRSCKHTRILNVWKRAGSPLGAVYDDEANNIGSLFATSFKTKDFSKFSISESIRMSN